MDTTTTTPKGAKDYTVKNREAFKLDEGEHVIGTPVGIRGVTGRGVKQSFLMDIDTIDPDTGEVREEALWLTTALVNSRDEIMEDWKGKTVKITCLKRTGSGNDPVQWRIEPYKA